MTRTLPLLIRLARMSTCNGSYSKILPHFVEGVVCKGFGRGSKDLGIPTANFDRKVIENLPKDLDCGIYYGMANVNGGPVYKAVLSIGWNPYYQNDKKSVETHILNTFDEDFYGSILRLVILGHIRPEKDFSSVDDLIAEIKNDICITDEKLKSNEYDIYSKHEFFKCLNGDTNSLI